MKGEATDEMEDMRKCITWCHAAAKLIVGEIERDTDEPTMRNILDHADAIEGYCSKFIERSNSNG